MKKLILLFVAFVPICLFSQVRIGGTEYESLQAACDAAVEDDVVTIEGEITLTGVYGISKSITVRGISSDAKIVFGSEGDNRLGFGGDTEIIVENLTIVGYPRSQRQMWVSDNCHVIFKNDTIRDCHNTGPNDEHGGAFLNVGTSTFEAHNCVFKNNKSSKNGGVFWAVDQCSVLLYDCLFTGNIAQYENEDGKGGVLASVGEGHTYYAENCAFIENGSEGHGGVIWIEHNQSMTCVNCTFSGNWAGGHGGAIGFWENASIDLINCTVYQNSVLYEGGGGAVFLNWGSNTVNMQNTVLTGNGYDDGEGTSGASNIEGEAENAPFTVTADNSYYTLTEDGTIVTEGSNSLNTGAILLEDVDLESGIYWNKIALETSVLVGLGDPVYLEPYSSTDQRGWDRDMESAICAGAYDIDAEAYDSVVVKMQIPDQEMDEIDELNVSYAGVMEVYLIPPSDIMGEVEYEVESSDEDLLTVDLDTDTEEIILSKETEEVTIATVTLRGYSPKVAYNEITFDVYLNQSLVSISNVRIKEIDLYPNPAADYILFPDLFESDLNISVFNVTGEVVLNAELQNSANRLDVSSLTSGLYFIKITDESGAVYSQRFIKE
ncbi:MAG: T9SS type A sorting domain-containing protein [Bacteroidales bacterium]|nr:T9SS type A sorting domain-containing protein [Bacteroidales bacterium]